MRREKGFMILALCLAAGLAFSGCSKKEPEKTPTQPAATTSEQKETEEEKPTEKETDQKTTEQETEEQTGEEPTSEEQTEEPVTLEPGEKPIEVGSVLNIGTFEEEELSWLVTSLDDGIMVADCQEEIPVDEAVLADPDAYSAWLAGDFAAQAFDEEESADILTVRAAEADGKTPEIVLWFDEPESLLDKAVSLAETDAERALEVFDLAKLALPESTSPYVEKMNLLKSLGRSEESIAEAKLVNETLGGSEEVYRFLMNAFMEEENYEEAAAAALEAEGEGFSAVLEEYEQVAADAVAAENYDLALTLYGLSGNEEKVEEISLILNPFKNLEVGDTYTFGVYEQDNNLDNGKEPINWIVMAKEGDKLWLVSEMGLDSMPFNRKRAAADWAGSSLRIWMNEEFIQSAFSVDELKWILPSETEEGVIDTAYLMSIDEAEEFFAAGNTWKLKVTDYAVSQGATYNNTRKSASWLLRSNGMDESSVAFVDYLSGEISGNAYVNARHMAIRPVICVGKESAE